MAFVTNKKTQAALDRVRQKHGLTNTTKVTKEKQSNKGTQSDKGKQSNSAPSTRTNENVSTITQSSFDRIRAKHGLSTKEDKFGIYPKKTTSDKSVLSDTATSGNAPTTGFAADTHNAYTNARNKLNARTIITSNLSEQERKARIKEINAELNTLGAKSSGYSRAKAYGVSKALLDAEKKDNERMAELRKELKTLERVGTFSNSEMLQWDIDDKKKEISSLNAKVNSYGQRPSGSEIEGWKNAISDRSKAQKELEALRAEQAEYKKIEKLDELNANTTKITSKEDYEQNSKYTPSKPKTEEELKAEGYKQDVNGVWYKRDGLLGDRKTYTGEDSNLYTYVNDKSRREELETIALARYGTNTYQDLGYNTLNEDEIGAFNYLYHQDRKNGTNTAEAYLQTISPLLQQRAMEAEAKRYAEVAKEHPVTSSVISLGTNAQNAMMFPTKVITTATGMYDDMPSIDMFGNRTQAIRGAVSEDMGVVGKLAYNATMSIGDMGVAMLAGGGNAKAIQAIMSSSAGSSTISEAKKNGASDGKALVLGLGSAAIEWATEKYSVEAILKNPKTIRGYLATNTFTEATEEGASNVANLALDAIVSEAFGEKNNIEQRIDYLMLYEGKSANEALKIAFNETLQSLGEDILVGGLTGAGMSTTVASPAIVEKGINKIRNRSNTQEGDNATDTNVSQDVNTIAPDTLEQAAMDVVASRNATQTENIEPISNVSQTEDSLPTQEENGLKTENIPPIENVTPDTALEVAQKEAEAKAIEAAFEAGRQNVPREKLTLATLEQEEAYNNGRIEHIKNMPKETPKSTNVDSTSKLTDKTKNVLDKNSKQRVVGIKDGRAYISDGRIAIPIAESDVEYTKSQWGLTDNGNIARVVEETLNNDFVPISTNPIEGNLSPIKSVYVFTTEDGRQIAIQKKYAKYFDGYNLSATFVKGKPYAIKATDADGKLAGIVMAIRPTNNTYELTDTKEVSMKSFKNKPVRETVTTANKEEANISTEEVTKETEYKHLYNEETASKEFLRSVNTEIENAILNIRDGNLESVPDVIEVTKLSDETVNTISDFVGFDVSGYACKIEKDALQHIEKRHGINGEKDQSLSDPKDTARMGYVINKIDNIEWVLKNGNIRRSKKYNNKDNASCPVMALSSRVDGTYCVSQVVPDTKRKTIWVTSARIEKADGGNQVPNGNNVTPQRTPETPLDSSSANDNLSQKMENVKMQTLKHTKNIYSLFKGAPRVVVGKDVIIASDVAMRLTDNALDEVKKVVNENNIELGGSASFDKFIPADNDVVISGNPKVAETTIKGRRINVYVFKIGNDYYVCEQKYLDAFNNGENIIKANKDKRKTWSVHDKDNKVLGAFIPTFNASVTDAEYDSFQSVADVLEANKARKTAQKNAPFNTTETRVLCSQPILMTFGMDGNQFITDSKLIIRVDSSEVDFIEKEYKAKSDNNKIATSDTLGEKVKNLIKSEAVGEVSQTVPDNITETDRSGKTKVKHRRTACIVDNMAFLFDTRYYDILSKRSSTMKILSGGGIANTIVAGYDSNGDFVGFIFPIRPADGSYIDVGGKQIPYTLNIEKKKPIKAETNKSVAKKETSEKTKVVETTTKLNDFGEKIGGARKDQWNSRGLVVDDLESMNDRERDKNVKKDNVWKRPNYRALVEAGGDRGLLWATNEIRKSLQQNVYYGYNATAETKAEKQKLFVETIRAIQSMAENAKTKADFEAMGEKWLMDNGYLEDTGKTYGRYAYTQQFSQNPALSGSNYLNTISYLVKNFDNLTALADRNQFAVDTKSVVPKGFSIVGGEGSVGGKLVNGEWVKDTSYGVAKGRYIIKDGFATREEALEWLKQGIAKKKGKTRFVPQQLLQIHRKGPDYRNSKSIAGQDYIDTFGFKGGEFGNWMSAKDRQVSLDYGFDALKDLADALGIEDADISFGGNLNIAFGARGQGLSGAAAHYENERRVINLTKMNGAGSLGHEWFHALDDFIGGYTNNYATDKYYSLPEKTKQAIRDLITTMQYKDATQEETDLAAQKRYEQAVRGITYTLESEFGWVKAVEEGTFNEANAKYYKRKPTKNDAKKYRELFNKLIETGEMKYVEELSALRKEVVGRVIPKEVRDSFVWRLPSLNSAKTAPIQRARKMTDFYTDSRTFGKLHSKDGDYWDSTVEMSARAFACYVADKTNKQNDYLTAHSDSAITLDTDKDGNPVVVRAYPVGEERIAINKAFDNLIEALKADGFLHERTQTEKPAEVSYEAALNKKMAEDDGVDKFTTNKSTDKLNDNEDEDKLAMWTTTRVGNKVKPKSITEIVATIEQKLGINITTGHIQGKGVLGQYDKNTRGIRTKIANNLPVISHELGHYFERTLDIQEQLTEELANELTSNLDERTLNNYPEEKLVREGVAEFTRRFLQNRETAAIDYPLFTDFFLSQLSAKDLAIFEQLADDINAYYSLDADTATSSIRLEEEGMIDLRTPMDKLKEKASSLYQAFIDSNHAIKRFDRATGSNAYMLATNAAYSDAIAGQIVTGDLTDINGQYVSSGLKTVLNGIDLNNKEEYRLFGEYLTVKHGPERLKEGKRVFADDKKNNTSFMERRQAELEAQYPQFEEISERLYGFIRKFYQTWAVDTGLLPKETLEFLNKRWEYYVPFNRVMEKGKGTFGAKRGFANQNNTLNKTKKDGSGRDIKHPVDNLINNIVRMVNAGVRNNVMLNITNSAEKLGADATFLEPVPMPLSVTKVDMTGVKDILTNWLEESDLDATSKDKASGVVNNFDDILLQYGRGKAHGNVVTVLKNGNPQAWKVNDVELLQSLTSLSPKTMDGLLDAIAITSRFMTANITGNNIVWSIFSNLPRDIGTFFTYSKNKNVVKMARGVGSAYLNKVKGDKANPLYKEFLAMGGGKTSAYTADRNLAKDVRKKISGRKFNPNPIDWIGYVSDIVEAGPRFATYKMMREAGMTPQEAFYESMDITTNFRRSGRISKDINKVVPFFNASVQGLDKFRRWITAEEVKGAGRKKAIRNRTISFVAVSAALAAIMYAINNGDDEKEEQYEQLSSFIKNSYWVIPVGDGKYFAIPKPREIGVLSSFFERCMELGIGENDHAFDEFYDYASENLLPAIANDIVQIPTKGFLESGMGIIGSLGLIGVVGYLGANRDFLGRPIVASGLQNLEPKDQYTDRTSKIAYWLGQAFNGSPEQIDYFFQQILGGWWKYPKALFPVGEKNVDWSLGVGNTYIKDNQYSTDLTNWLYDRADTTAKSKNSNPDDMEKAIAAKWDSNMVDFYGTYYKKAKAESKSVSARSTRQLVLDILREYQKGIDGDYKTSWQEGVERVCMAKGSTEYMPSVMSSEVTDGNDMKHSLSDAQYVEYQTDYLRLYWETVEETMSNDMTIAEKAKILTAAKTVAREQATERTLKRIGATSTKFATQYKGISNDTLTEFLAGVSIAGDDDKLLKEEVVGVISELDVDNDDAWKLYLSKYDNENAIKAEKHGINAKLYMTSTVDMANIHADYIYNGERVDGKDLTKEQKKKAKEVKGSRRDKIETYLNSVCNSYKEYLFLLGIEYESILDDYDYVAFFGE